MSIPLNPVMQIDPQSVNLFFEMAGQAVGAAAAQASRSELGSFFFQGEQPRLSAGLPALFRQAAPQASRQVSQLWQYSSNWLNPYKNHNHSSPMSRDVVLFSLPSLAVVAIIGIGIGLVFGCSGCGRGPIGDEFDEGGGTGGPLEDDGGTTGASYSDTGSDLTGAYDTSGTTGGMEDTDGGDSTGMEECVPNLDATCDPFDPDYPDQDFDCDGLLNGVEDKNQNCFLDPYEETDPYNSDTDYDQIPDGTEDRNLNGVCEPDETCANNPDTDADALYDGEEDCNLNGLWDEGAETSALEADTDADGLYDAVDACPLNADLMCEGEAPVC